MQKNDEQIWNETITRHRAKSIYLKPIVTYIQVLLGFVFVVRYLFYLKIIINANVLCCPNFLFQRTSV